MGRISLTCRECKEEYDASFKYVCDECFGPLDVKYDFPNITKEMFQHREHTFWRYFEMLPILDKSNIVNIGAGMTPLIKAERLGESLGLKNLYIKNDSVNPTFSFKDRPAGVAVSKAVEFKLKSVGCASTGNLASSTSAYAAKAGLKCHVFAPSNLEMAKMAQSLSYGANYMPIDGTYDDANRLSSIIGDKYDIGTVNGNLRSYYVEGSKTFSYEVSEQLNWQSPDHVIVPVGSGAMLNAICKGFEELEIVDLIDNDIHIHAAQPAGCDPITKAYMNDGQIKPVEHPDTIAKSLAIGDPGDGKYALERLKQYDGYAFSSTDEEIINGIKKLAKYEGIYTEPAGGVAICALEKLAEKIDPEETVIIYVTGNGLKSTETMMEYTKAPNRVNIKDVEDLFR